MATAELPVRPAGAAVGRLPVEKLDAYPNCYPDVNPVDVYRSHIMTIVHDITGVDTAIIYNALQWTQTQDKGDLVLVVPALRVKGKKPTELAEEWAAKFPESPLIEKPTVSGTFIQFFFKPGPLTHLVIPSIRSLATKFGENHALGLKDPNDPSKGKNKIIVEFSSPNIAKPFHAGHLRSTIIGGFLAKLYAAAGWDVVRINYLGDWGKQYGMLAVAFERYGNEDALKENPIGHLFDIYVRINQDKGLEDEEIKKLQESGDTAGADEMRSKSVDQLARDFFKKMVDGDEKALEQWKRFRDLSITRYKATYARLNIEFDEYSGESQVPESAMEDAANKLAEKDITEGSDGATIINFQKHVPGKVGKALEKPIIRKKDGTALYLTRDISELLGRHEKYNFDKMIYVVASQQDLHLKQLFKIIELMGHTDIAKKVQHINFGMVLGMSTRKGTVKFLDDILRMVGDKMHEVMRTNEGKYKQVENPEATADVLGISSVMVQDMTGKRINNYEFNMEAMTSFEGDTGPYLQYAHARLCSIARKASMPEEEIASANLDLLAEPHAVNLVRMIAQYPDVVANALKTLEPCTILVYLFKMTHVVSSSYEHLQVVGAEKEVSKARMALYDATRTVLANGMRILGLSPVDRM